MVKMNDPYVEHFPEVFKANQDTAFIREPIWVKAHPYVGEDGIYEPCQEYVQEGTSVLYRLVISKEMFVEAYNKWIKPTAEIVRCSECKHRGTTACMMYHEYWLDTFDEPCFSDYTHDDGYCHAGERWGEDE